MRSIISTYFSLANAKIYWLFVLLCGLYAIFGEINTPAYVLPTIAALVAAGLVLHKVKYSWMSFVSIFTLAHVIAYPVGIMLVLSLTSPTLAIESEIWETTPLGLWAMVVGMCGLILGIILTRLRLFPSHIHSAPQSREAILTPVWFNMGLTLLIVPVVVIYINAGIYYHSNVTGIDAYNFANANSLGFVGYLVYITYGGLVLQIRRYLSTKLMRDLKYALFCTLLPLFVMLPSGSRANTMIIGVIALIYFLHMETRVKLKYLVFSLSIILFLSLTLSIEAYRLLGLKGNSISFFEQITSVIKTLSTSDNKADTTKTENEISRAILGRRLSDIHSSGYLVSIIPENFPHRGFNGMLDFPYYLLPTVFRPEVDLDYNYDAVLMADTYQFRSDTGGSSPMMIIGELYERFGWPGIFLGFACIGFLLKRLDRWVSANTIKGTLIWAMLFYAVVNMHTYSLLKIFTLTTRQLIIFMLIVYLLERILYTFSGSFSLFKVQARYEDDRIGASAVEKMP